MPFKEHQAVSLSGNNLSIDKLLVNIEQNIVFAITAANY